MTKKEIERENWLLRNSNNALLGLARQSKQMYDRLVQVCDTLMKVMPKHDGWIPIDEKLPDPEVEVLVYTTWADPIQIAEMTIREEPVTDYRGIRVGARYVLKWEEREGNTIKHEDVKAWLPMPEKYRG